MFGIEMNVKAKDEDEEVRFDRMRYFLGVKCHESVCRYYDDGFQGSTMILIIYSPRFTFVWTKIFRFGGYIERKIVVLVCDWYKRSTIEDTTPVFM